MAKSLRSSRVKNNRDQKRKTVFGEADAARELRIREHLHQAAVAQLERKKEEKLAAENVNQDDSMDIDSNKPAKASTGGWNKKRKDRKKKSKSKSKKIRKH